MEELLIPQNKFMFSLSPQLVQSNVNFKETGNHMKENFTPFKRAFQQQRISRERYEYSH